MSLSDGYTPTTIPIIMCPSCGEHMRLSTILPDERQQDRMTFVCDCGFDYRQSIAASVERTL